MLKMTIVIIYSTDTITPLASKTYFSLVAKHFSYVASVHHGQFYHSG
jgi:hypothetical protein